MDLPIINECDNLPPFAIRRIKKILRLIPPLDLIGIDQIRLTYEVPDENNLNFPGKSEIPPDGMPRMAGRYWLKTEKSPPFIEVFIKNLYYPISYFANFTPFPTLYIARIIAHEIGHHLIRTRGYVFTRDEKYPPYEKKPEIEEDMAQRYAIEVVRKMKKKLNYKIGASVMNFYSKYYYLWGIAFWQEEKFEASADCFWKSIVLNSERSEAIEYYWYAKKRIKPISKKENTG